MNAPSSSPLLDAPPAWIDKVTPPIDFLSVWAGKIASWLIVPMFLVLVYEVTARKLGYPTLWANDVATMCYGAHFFLTGAYALKLQKHIRTDFLSRNWTLKTQVRMDLVQYLLVFLPGMVMLTYISMEFAWESWELRERLMTTWRPPAYWYKAVIPLSALLILLQGIAEVLKCVKTLYTGVDYREHQGAEEIT